jgi:Tol biopolymer transport system component
MSLERPGANLDDRYVIERELGAGGMATVYLAHDVRHDRKVALKVLRPELSAILGAERFLAEIKTTANLQHPHILSLFDSGEADGLVYYVMPYVEGESLRDRLTREKQLPVDEAVRIASEVAGALQYAHEHGIVHRDIKPENILLHGGHALVADFGIALAASRSEGGNRLTETGMSLGTPYYMAPEQAMGEREITPKADIYALGCVLYEMLTAEPPFTGATAQSIIARVMTEEPRSLTQQRKSIPPYVEAAVFVALEKLPADRFQTARQFAEALGGAGTPPASRTATRLHPGTVSSGWAGRRVRWSVAVAVSAVTLAVGLLAGRGLRPAAGEVLALQLLPGPDHRLGMPAARNLAVSPDGRTLSYVGQGPRGKTLYVRPLDAFSASALGGTEGRVFSDPVFSNDGRSLTWIEDNGSIHRASIAGGAATQVGPSSTCCTMTMAPDDGVLVMTERGLELVVTAGGPGRVIGPLVTGTAAVPLPGFTSVVYTAPGLRRVHVLTLATGQSTPVEGLPDGVDDVAYADGWLLFQTGTVLSAVRFDAARGRISGRSAVLVAGVRVAANGGFRESQSAVGGRTLAYVPAAGNNRIAIVDRAGREVLLPDTTGVFHRPRFSPEGRRLSVDITRAQSRDVWIYDFDQRTMSRVTFEPNGHDAIWAPDGRSIFYNASLTDTVFGLLSRRTDGSGSVDTIARDPGFASPEALTADGTAILSYGLGGAETKEDAWLVERATGTHSLLLGGTYDEAGLSLSHDGRWLAWASNESGRYEIYVRALTGGPRVQITTAGGREPVWNQRGGELFYRVQTPSGSRLMAARISLAPLRVVSRDTLFDVTDYEEADPHANYDVSPDGTRFVFIRQLMPNEIRVIRNWQALLERR